MHGQILSVKPSLPGRELGAMGESIARRSRRPQRVWGGRPISLGVWARISCPGKASTEGFWGGRSKLSRMLCPLVPIN
jgi:hypothetical protein